MALRRVFLDPDGTLPASWLHVIIEAKTGVLYAHQCAGVACDQREIEGFLVPVGGLKLEPNRGLVDASELTAVFHRGATCLWSMCGNKLPPDRLARLERAVAAIPWWSTPHERDEELRSSLRLDTTRLSEIAEAWLPVVTVDGIGILVWPNCD